MAVKYKKQKSRKTDLISLKSRIRAIGNSKGVILSNELIKKAGLNPEIDILIKAAEGMIAIVQVKTTDVNTNLGTWDRQFKNAIKNGAIPDSDLLKGLSNDFDKNEW